MSTDAVMRCGKCDRAHKVKVLGTKSSKNFNFQCRCLNTITGSYDKGEWTISNAALGQLKEGEAVYFHEPVS